MDEIYYEIKKIKEYVCKEKFVNSMSNIFANGFEFYFEINLMCNKFRKNVSHNYLSAILYV